MVVSNRVAFWDNDNFVIVTKNCSREQARRLLKAIAEADMAEVEIGLPAEVEPLHEEEVVYQIPEQPSVEETVFEEAGEENEAVFPSGRYKGLTPAKVLEMDKDKGYGNMAYLLGKVSDERLRSQMRADMHSYFCNRFRCEDPYALAAKMSHTECLDFFGFFGTVVTEEDKKKILSQAGETDWGSFIAGTGLENLRSLVGATIKKYT